MLIDITSAVGGYLHDVFVTNLDWWVLLGFVAQAFFTARFLVQWIASERAGRSVIPMAFWLFSIGGGALLLIRRGAALLGADVAGWRQVPVTVTIAIAALSCVLWRSLSMERARSASPMEHRDVVALAAEIRSAMAQHANVLKRLAYQPASNTADWARVANAQIDTVPAFAAIAWVTPALDTKVEMDHDPARRRLGAEAGQGMGERHHPVGRVDAEKLALDARRVGQRPEQIEDRADAELAPRRTDMAHRGVMGGGEHEADAGLGDAAADAVRRLVDLDAERREDVGGTR